jgi:hypothetical protein
VVRSARPACRKALVALMKPVEIAGRGAEGSLRQAPDVSKDEAERPRPSGARGSRAERAGAAEPAGSDRFEQARGGAGGSPKPCPRCRCGDARVCRPEDRHCYRSGSLRWVQWPPHAKAIRRWPAQSAFGGISPW